MKEKAVMMNELDRPLSNIVLGMETEEGPNDVRATKGATYSAFAHAANAIKKAHNTQHGCLQSFYQDT
jgi:hypothetical protein